MNTRIAIGTIFIFLLAGAFSCASNRVRIRDHEYFWLNDKKGKFIYSLEIDPPSNWEICKPKRTIYFYPQLYADTIILRDFQNRKSMVFLSGKYLVFSFDRKRFLKWIDYKLNDYATDENQILLDSGKIDVGVHKFSFSVIYQKDEATIMETMSAFIEKEPNRFIEVVFGLYSPEASYNEDRKEFKRIIESVHFYDE